MAKLLTHQIRVETEEENVTVTIGNDGGVPGGFARSSSIGSSIPGRGHASPMPRAAAVSAPGPLCRSSAERQFRVQMGQATLMRLLFRPLAQLPSNGL